jgi:periplasmic protein TonB
MIRIYTQTMNGAPSSLDWQPALRPTRRGGLMAGVLACHVLAAWGLLLWAPVQRAVSELAPVFVSLIAESQPTPAQPAPAKPPTRFEAARPIAWSPVSVAPAPKAAAPAAPAEPAPPASAPALTVATLAMPAPPVTPVTPATPAPAPTPKTISISQVAYLSPPQLDYPQAARRMQEQGQVHVRVLVDAEGRPQQMSVVRSSGHARLDEAALAAVRATRFKPYAENGLALPFWVVMPLVFELDN